MAAPDLTQREVCFVQKIGTDDAGANAVGAPQPRLTIAAALADLAANYPPATATFFHIVAVGPGTFTEAGISLPPYTFIEGTCDGESQPTSIILLTGDINLSSAWTANATARGGFSNLSIRAASGNPVIDFTMPVPVAGNPTRTVELHNVHHNLTSEVFEATSTADNYVKEFCRQFGVNTDTFRQTGGTSRFNNVWSAALVTIIDKASFATVGNWDGMIISATGSSVTASSIAAAGTTLRLTNSTCRALVLAQPAPGVLAVSADAPSVPIRSAVTYTGLASATNLALLSDAAGEAYTPTTPANWSPVPTTVQGALDTLGASAGGGSGTIGTFAQIVRTGARSSAAWGTAGVAINDTLNTFTDTTSAGAVAGVTAARTFGVPTFASAGGVTYADAANLYIAGPPVITGGTATNLWALYIASGNVRIGGTITSTGTTNNSFAGPIRVSGQVATIVASSTYIDYTGTNVSRLLAFGSNPATIPDFQLFLGSSDNSINKTGLYINGPTGNLLLGGIVNGTGVLQLLGTSGTSADGMSFGATITFFRNAANGLTNSGFYTTTGAATANLTSAAGFGFSGGAVLYSWGANAGTAGTFLLQSLSSDGSINVNALSISSAQIATFASHVSAVNGMSIFTGSAIPAGGTAGVGYKFSSTANFGTFFGSGAPTLAAAKGSLYLRSNGTGINDRAFINTDGGTTWTALVSVA